jgi:TRAP-type C4-dicarboxylate transport system permease small subunit
MIAMGVLAVILAFTGPGMSSGGWQTQLSAWLQHLSSVALDALSWVPGWLLLAVLLLSLAALIRRALHTPAANAAENESVTPTTADALEEKTHG